MSEKKPAIGTIRESGTLILRSGVGEATRGRKKYELSSSLGGLPIIRSRQTGRWFLLSWQEIIELAELAGIDTKPKPRKTAHKAD